jgi:thioredoxin-related protein
MRRILILLTVVLTVGMTACQWEISKFWFNGDLEAALAEAGASDTVVMIEFFADWCGWCRRLETDTFTAPEVRRELEKIVSMRRDAEKEGADLAKKFGVDSYPTMVFLDPEGHEIDRILGYLPPEKFLRRVQRIRTGDTFLACLRQLKEDPGDIDAITRSVSGLLERADPEGAIFRIEAFHQATEGRELDLCRRLMFSARGDLHGRIYQRAAKLYRGDWPLVLNVPDTAGTASLHAMIAEGLMDLPADEQAKRLRQARYDDAAALLEIPDLESATPAALLDVADFAFSNGHFDRASDLYLRWYGVEGDAATPENLNDVAWRLYLSGRRLDHAIGIARQSYAAKPDPETGDTLARLLYVNGSVDEAIALEEAAAEEAEGSRSEIYLRVAQRMEAGESLDDKPTFDSYPGKRRKTLQAR